MKIGVRINLTQVDDEMIHDLFQIHDILEFNNDNNIKLLLESMKNKAKKFIEGFKV